MNMIIDNRELTPDVFWKSSMRNRDYGNEDQFQKIVNELYIKSFVACDYDLKSIPDDLKSLFENTYRVKTIDGQYYVLSNPSEQICDESLIQKYQAGQYVKIRDAFFDSKEMYVIDEKYIRFLEKFCKEYDWNDYAEYLKQLAML